MITARSLAAAAAVFTLSACHRAPQTAGELLNRLPRQYSGTAHLQGDTTEQPLRLECRELAVRGEHLLEFSGINLVMLDANGATVSERLTRARGTISAPGGEIKLEDLGAPGGGEDVLRAGTFSGKISDDLQTAEATWTTAYGTKGSLKLKAIR